MDNFGIAKHAVAGVVGQEPGHVSHACAPAGRPAAACPLSQCSAMLAVSAGLPTPTEVQCQGMPVWAWPSGVSLDPPPAASAARRRLGDCDELYAASVAASAANDAAYATGDQRNILQTRAAYYRANAALYTCWANAQMQ